MIQNTCNKHNPGSLGERDENSRISLAGTHRQGWCGNTSGHAHTCPPSFPRDILKNIWKTLEKNL